MKQPLSAKLELGKLRTTKFPARSRPRLLHLSAAQETRASWMFPSRPYMAIDAKRPQIPEAIVAASGSRQRVMV